MLGRSNERGYVRTHVLVTPLDAAANGLVMRATHGMPVSNDERLENPEVRYRPRDRWRSQRLRTPFEDGTMEPAVGNAAETLCAKKYSWTRLRLDSISSIAFSA